MAALLRVDRSVVRIVALIRLIPLRCRRGRIRQAIDREAILDLIARIDDLDVRPAHTFQTDGGNGDSGRLGLELTDVIAVTPENRIMLRIIIGDVDAASVPRLAYGRVGIPGLIVIGKAKTTVYSNPVEGLARDEVDDAADRIGTIGRRAAVRNDIDTFDSPGGNGVEIRRSYRQSHPHYTMPIDQHQRRRGADKVRRRQAAQIGTVSSNLIAVSLRRLKRIERAHARYGLEQLGHRAGARRFHGRLVERDYIRASRRVATNQRASDDDLVLVHSLTFGRIINVLVTRYSLLRERRRGERHQADCRQNEIMSCAHCPPRTALGRVPSSITE